MRIIGDNSIKLRRKKREEILIDVLPIAARPRMDRFFVVLERGKEEERRGP